MSYIGEEEMAAPVLHAVRLTRAEAKPLFDRVIRNIEIMLAHRRVHGDLSAYNILYWDGEISLIDFPQAIDPDQNRNGYRIFERDVTRICEYFTRQGVACAPHRLAADLWTAHNYRLMPEIHPSLLDEQDERDVALWKTQHGG
jgi:RIO kinase 1